MQIFTTTAKVVLLGEHAVLRGSQALSMALPHFNLQFHLSEYSGKKGFEYEVIGRDERIYDLIFLGALEKALKKVGRQRQDISGYLQIVSTLPVSRGLGSSASLCVSLAKIFNKKGWLETRHIYSFAKDIESLFHGQSSGLDIATVLSEGMLLFQNNSWTPMVPEWHPHFYLTYSGVNSTTSLCVDRVQSFQKSNFQKALELDEQMNIATIKAVNALSKKKISKEEKNRQIKDFFSHEDRLQALAESINEAYEIFKKWGLVNETVSELIFKMKQQGALAAKPVGSGLGGYVLSLWPDVPKDNSLVELPLFEEF